MIYLKSPSEIDRMRRAGRLLASVFIKIAGLIKPGVVTADIDAYAENQDILKNYKNHYKKFTWKNPPEGFVTVTMTYSVLSSSDWNKFVTSDKFPFNSEGLPDSVTEFLQPSPMVQSNHPNFIDLANALTYDLSTQWEAMTALNGWVIDNIAFYEAPV